MTEVFIPIFTHSSSFKSFGSKWKGAAWKLWGTAPYLICKFLGKMLRFILAGLNPVFHRCHEFGHFFLKWGDVELFFRQKNPAGKCWPTRIKASSPARMIKPAVLFYWRQNNLWSGLSLLIDPEKSKKYRCSEKKLQSRFVEFTVPYAVKE